MDTPEEKEKSLQTLASLLAETLDCPVDVAELRSVLQSEDVDTWRSAVAELEVRQMYGKESDEKEEGCGAPVMRWVCPSCGRSQELLDLQKALRSKADAAVVSDVSNQPLVSCQFCPQKPQELPL